MVNTSDAGQAGGPIAEINSNGRATKQADNGAPRPLRLHVDSLRRLSAGAVADPLAWAEAYAQARLFVVPVRYGDKRPYLEDWQHLRLRPDHLDEHFGRKRVGVGVLLGASGVADVDLDSPEARAVAPYLLPPTLTFGRESARRSHWLYQTDERQETQQFKLGKECLVELRDTSKKGTSHQTVFPPSMHASGEARGFDDLREIAVIGAAELHARCSRVAAAAVLVRLWPRGAGVRHDAALALAGALLDAGLGVGEAEAFVRAVCGVAGDKEMEDRVRTVRSTAEARASGGKTTGAPRLRELLAPGDQEWEHLRRALSWLNHEGHKAGDATAVEDGEGVEESSSKAKGGRETVTDVVLRLAAEAGVELWTDPSQEAYATLWIGGHPENYRLKTKAVRLYLDRLYFAERRRSPGGQALQDALNTLESQARWDGESYRTAVRVAEVKEEGGPVVYIDLGNDAYEVVEVRAGRWGYVAAGACPVRFLRSAGQRALPAPVRGGDSRRLLEFVNLDEAGFVLVAGWCLQALRDNGPYPVLSITGEAGSGKSTALDLVRSLVDPFMATHTSMFTSEREAYISAQYSHVLSFDNNTGSLKPWQSDMLCRLSTGGAFRGREYYSGDEEQIFEARKPVIINAVADPVTAPDLAQRTFAINLPRIGAAARQGGQEVHRAFGEARGEILGGLLDAMADGFARLPTLQVEGLPRLADCARFLIACEPALGLEDGAVRDALDESQAGLVEIAVGESLVGHAVRALLPGPGDTFRGTATELLDRLEGAMRYGAGRGESAPPREWPKAPNALSGKLREIAGALRELGYEVELDLREPGGNRARFILIQNQREEDRPDRPGRPETGAHVAEAGYLDRDGPPGSGLSQTVPHRPTVIASTPSPIVSASSPIVPNRPGINGAPALVSQDRDGWDGRDDPSAPRS